MDYTTVGGPVLLGVLIASATYLKWPSWVNYVLAAVSILWGLMGLAY